MSATSTKKYWKAIVVVVIAVTVAIVAPWALGFALTSLNGMFIGGMAAGFAAGFSGTLLNGGSLRSALINGGIGGIKGGFSGMLGYGVLQAVQPAISALVKVQRLAAAMAHGVKGSVVTLANGGNSGAGFLSGFAGAGVGGIGQDYYLDVVMGAVLGGTVSVIAGGKFASGAFTGAMAAIIARVALEATYGPQGPRGPRNKRKEKRYGLLQRLLPAHTARFCKNPIGGSVESQLAYANHVNGIRTVALKGAVASVGLMGAAPYVAEFGPLIPLGYDKLTYAYYAWGASTTLDIRLYTTLNNLNAFSTTSNFQMMYGAGVARIPVFTEAYFSHISAASSWTGVAGEFAGALNTD